LCRKFRGGTGCNSHGDAAVAERSALVLYIFCSFIYYFGQELKLGVGAFIVALFEERASAFEPKFVGETQDFGPECFALHRESRQTLE